MKKAASGTRRATTVKAKPGRYRVVAYRTVYNGAEYRPEVSKKSFRLKRAKTQKVTITWKKVATDTKLEVVSTDLTSVRVAWDAKKGRRFELRRTAGEKAPTSRRAGKRVYAGKARGYTDRKLTSGKRYSYALFSQVKVKSPKNGKAKTKWLAPTTVTAATTAFDPLLGGPGASYSLSPGTVIVDAGDSDRVFVQAGQVRVTFAGNRPPPSVGAGVGLPTSAQLPGGFIGKVAEVAPDGRTVRLSAAAVIDLFDHYDIQGAFSAPLTPRTPIKVGTLTSAARGTASPAQRRANTGSAPAGSLAASRIAEQDTFGPCEPGGALALDLHPSLGAAGSFDYKIHKKGVWKAKVPVAVSLFTDVNVTAKLEGGVEAKADMSCDYAMEDLFKTVTTTPVPMSVKFSATVGVTAEGSGAYENISVQNTSGVSSTLRLGTKSSFAADPYNRPSSTTPTFSDSGNGKVSAAVAGSLIFGPGAGSRTVGAIAGVEGELTLAYLNLDSADKDPAGVVCHSLSAGSEAALYLHASAWAGPLELHAQRELWQSNNKPWLSHRFNCVEPPAPGPSDPSPTDPTPTDPVPTNPTPTNPVPTAPEPTFPGSPVPGPELGTGPVRATLRWANGTNYDLKIFKGSSSGTNPDEELSARFPNRADGGRMDASAAPVCGSPTANDKHVENAYFPPLAPDFYLVWVSAPADALCEDGDDTWTLTVKLGDSPEETYTGTAESMTPWGAERMFFVGT